MQLNSWNDGYHTELEVYDGYVSETSPLNIDLNLTIAGYDCDCSVTPNTPNTKDFIESKSATTPLSSLDSKNTKSKGTPNKIGKIKYYNYLELGFGKGTSLNVHAASSLSHFVGADFNPKHAVYAREFAKRSGANMDIYDDSFAELESKLDSTIGLNAPDSKKFDYIVLHGVFSWISKANQDTILRIIRKYLKLGGFVYNSYNCLPGWANKMPARHIFALYNQFSHDAPMNRIANCLTFFEKFLSCDPMFSKVNPQNLDFLQQMKNLPNSQKSYIAHEYLNADWDLFYFSDIVNIMDNAKCSFLCSGKVIEHFEEFSITKEGAEFLNTIDNKIFREQLKDYFTNRQFRVDLYARACRNITIFEAREKLMNTSFMLTRLTKDFDFKADTARGTISLMQDRYENLLEIMSDDSYNPKTLREIIDKSKLTFPQAMSSIMLLIHKGMASVAQDINDRILAQARGFNDYLFREQSLHLSSLYAASVLTSSAIVMNESEQIFAKAYNEVARRDDSDIATLSSVSVEGVDNDLANLFATLESNINDTKALESYLTQYVFHTFKPQNRRHIKDGKILESDKENIEEIKRLSSQFIEKLTLYKALKIVE